MLCETFFRVQEKITKYYDSVKKKKKIATNYGLEDDEKRGIHHETAFNLNFYSTTLSMSSDCTRKKLVLLNNEN